MVEDQEDLELQLHLFHQVHKHSLVEAEVVMEMHLADRLEDQAVEHHRDLQLQQILEEAAEAEAPFKELQDTTVVLEEFI
jgi:hypothetical protein